MISRIAASARAQEAANKLNAALDGTVHLSPPANDNAEAWDALTSVLVMIAGGLVGWAFVGFVLGVQSW